MSKGLSLTYGDAVRLLSDDPVALQRLDQALGLGLLAAAPFHPAFVLPLFDAKAELVRQLSTLVGGVRERYAKAPATDQLSLLVAAHAVIVMASFVEELTDRLHALDPRGRWAREIRQWAKHDRGDEPGSGRQRVVEWSAQLTVEPPTPTRPFDDVRRDIAQLYQALSLAALDYVRGLARWDEMAAGRRLDVEQALTVFLPASALRRYQGNYLKLAGDVPAFLAWIFVTDQSATHKLVESLLSQQRAGFEAVERRLARLRAAAEKQATALASIPELLAVMDRPDAAPPPAGIGQTLDTHHRLQRRVLDKPLLKPGIADDLTGLVLPVIADGYVSPTVRVAEVPSSGGGVCLAQESWWESRPVRGTLAPYLVAHLTTPRAVEVPLLVLGHPGSGKSLLSKVIAAQLPADRYVTVRVELRHVDPAASIADQIERSLRLESNNAYGWRELSDTTSGLTRVVVLDGLDELLQLSQQEGLGRYLERVEQFQEREAALGRPTAVLVTARTLVMDRIYVPARTVAIKLEPFDEGQVAAWLEVWNGVNRGYFRDRGLRPCSPATLVKYLDLAGQPLLLLMLALYDADGNALGTETALTTVQLYEKLFRQFVLRELRKLPGSPDRPESQEAQVEERLDELSAVAVAMFNRGRKFVSRDEVGADLAALGLLRRHGVERPVPVTPDMALGQFFFLYQAEHRAAGTEVRHGYEFHHATFGEFLVARALVKALVQLGTASTGPMAWGADALPNLVGGYLSPYLAHRPMVGETQLVRFVGDLCAVHLPDRAAVMPALGDAIRVLHREVPQVGRYDPAGRTGVEVAAVWSLNLLLVAVVVNGGRLTLTPDLLGPDVIRSWRRLLYLWKSQLEPDDWDALLVAIDATAGPDGALTLDLDTYYGLAASAVQRAGLPLLEGHLAVDHQLRLAGRVWWRATEAWSASPHRDDGEAALNDFAESLAVSIGPDDGLNAPIVRRAGVAWLVPLASVGPAAWPDDVLNHLLDHLTQAAASTPVDWIPADLCYRLLGAVLRETVGRGLSDRPRALLGAIRSLPEAAERDFYDVTLLTQMAYAYRKGHLRRPILAALPPSWRHDEMAGLLGPATVEWVVEGLDDVPDPTPTLAEASTIARRRVRRRRRRPGTSV